MRLVVLAALATLCALTLYLPASFPPERFLDQMRIEHALSTDVRGSRYAISVLDRALELRAAVATVPLAPANREPPPRTTTDAQLAQHLAATADRLLGNSYFASVEAMFAMALYRLSALVESLGLALAFGAAALVDGFLRRAVKSKAFEHHHPEVFGACGGLILLISLLALLAFIAPTTLHPHLIACLPLVVFSLAAIGLANFHARG